MSVPIRPLLRTGLALGPVTIVVDATGLVSGVWLFVLAAAALIPLAWLIGEATEEAARWTGAGLGGFLNASFGNAPELIVAVVALAHGLPQVVLASVTGSIVSNLLLLLGLALVVRKPGEIDRTSALVSLATVAGAALVLLVPAAAGWQGSLGGRGLAGVSVAAAMVLLAARVLINRRMLRRHRRLQAAAAPPQEGRWSLRTAVLVLGGATLMTAFVTEILVGALRAFAASAHLSEFFVAVVVVAIVANVSEHASAVLVAARGDTRLATEIALASSAQVAAFLIPAVALLSWSFDPLRLTFRPIELAAMGGAALAGAVVLFSRPTRLGGAALIAGYCAAVFAFYAAGTP